MEKKLKNSEFDSTCLFIVCATLLTIYLYLFVIVYKINVELEMLIFCFDFNSLHYCLILEHSSCKQHCQIITCLDKIQE